MWQGKGDVRLRHWGSGEGLEVVQRSDGWSTAAQSIHRRRSALEKKESPTRSKKRHRARNTKKNTWGVRGERGRARGRFGYLLERAGRSGELVSFCGGCCELAAGGGVAGGARGLQAWSGEVDGGAEKAWDATVGPLLPSTCRWLEWVYWRIILSPLSLYGSHQVAACTGGFWWL